MIYFITSQFQRLFASACVLLFVRSLAYINIPLGNSKEFRSIVLLVSEANEGWKIVRSVRKLDRTTTSKHYFPLKLGIKLPLTTYIQSRMRRALWRSKIFLQIFPHIIFSLKWTKFRKRKRLNPHFVTFQKMFPLFHQCLIYKSPMITTTKHKYEARKL